MNILPYDTEVMPLNLRAQAPALPDTHLQILALTFDLPLSPPRISQWRGAMAAAVGLENDEYHNHRPDGGFRYRYPLVQYRCHNGNAALLALGEAAQSVGQWLGDSPGPLRLGADLVWPRILEMDARTWSLRLLETPRLYRLNDWLALNQVNYRYWDKLDSLEARARELDRILAANIIAFAKGVHWQVPGRFEARVRQIRRTRRLTFKGAELMGFDVSFSCNVDLPPGIGLGKGISHGFGACWAAPQDWKG